MRSVNIAEFKAKMGRYLRLVRAGAEIILMDRNHPVAKISPLPKGSGKISVRAPSENPKEIASLSFAPVRGRRTNSLSFLLEDRRSR